MLEIGPGDQKLEGFEALNVSPGLGVDYPCDASQKLPFESNTFDVVYASHVLEHIPWYHVEDTVKEWARILKKGGNLEIFVPDALKICRTWIDFEENGIDNIEADGWYRFNDEKEPCKWASGRIFTYGDGTGNINNPNWHRSLFSQRYLIKVFEKAGLSGIRKMKASEVRGHDHGWINLGITGSKLVASTT